MMRSLLLIFISLLFPILCCGQGTKLLALDLEWGYGAGAYSYSHSNYVAEKGFRIDESNSEFKYWSNVFVLAGVGLNAGPRSTFTFLTGYTGITSYRNAVPFLLRYSWYHQGRFAPSFKLSLDAGPAVGGSQYAASGKSLAWLGDLGFGYSYPLLDSFRLEITGLIRCSVDHPAVTDATTGLPVPASNLFRTNALHLSLGLSIALAF